MHKTASIIRAEHRRLAAVLNCLDGVLDDVQADKLQPDFDLFDAVLNYLETFLYRFHHPKEDSHLFPTLLRRSPEAQAVIDRLEAEHEKGEALTKRLRETLTQYRTEGAPGLDAFREAAKAYHQFEWQHMGTEEREVLPLAERILTEEDWQTLDAVFTDHDDPVFGDKPQAAFGQLLSSIVNQAPAPHGLA